VIIRRDRPEHGQVKVRVNVHPAWKNNLSRSVDHLTILRDWAGAYPCNLLTFNEQVRRKARFGGDQSSISD
jgi:hypothetical protein